MSQTSIQWLTELLGRQRESRERRAMQDQQVVSQAMAKQDMQNWQTGEAEKDRQLRREIAAMGNTPRADEPSMATVRRDLPDGSNVTYKQPLGSLDLSGSQPASIDPALAAEIAAVDTKLNPAYTRRAELKTQIDEGNLVPGPEWASGLIKALPGTQDRNEQLKQLNAEIAQLEARRTRANQPPRIPATKAAPMLSAASDPYPTKDALLAAVQSGQLPVAQAQQIALAKGWN